MYKKKYILNTPLSAVAEPLFSLFAFWTEDPDLWTGDLNSRLQGLGGCTPNSAKNTSHITHT